MPAPAPVPPTAFDVTKHASVFEPLSTAARKLGRTLSLPYPTPDDPDDTADPEVIARVVAAGLYVDVRELSYRVRHALVDRFSWPELLGSGRGAVFGRATLTEQQVATLLATLFVRLLTRVDFHYTSGDTGVLFGFWSDGGSKLVVSPNSRSLTPCKEAAGYNWFGGTPVVKGECSAIATSLAHVLWVFGFPLSRVAIEKLSASKVRDNELEPTLVMKAPRHVERDALRRLCSTTPLAEATEDGPHLEAERFTSATHERIETEAAALLREHLPGYDRGRRPGVFLNAAHPASRSLAAQFGGVLQLDPLSGLLHPTRRCEFAYHVATRIVSTQRDEHPSAFSTYDPLYEVRYRNGIEDLFEEYDCLHGNKYKPLVVNMFESKVNRLRRIYSIPGVAWRVLHEHLGKPSTVWDRYRFPLGKPVGDFRSLYNDRDALFHLLDGKRESFRDLERRLTLDGGLSLDEFLACRYGQWLFIAVDERNWISSPEFRKNVKHAPELDDAFALEKGLGHPYDIVRLLGPWMRGAAERTAVEDFGATPFRVWEAVDRDGDASMSRVRIPMRPAFLAARS